MSNTAKILTQLSRIQIFGELVKTTEIDIKGWLANQGYYITRSEYGDQYELTNFSGQSSLITALANDCNRMAMASIESVCGISNEKKLPKSSAWGLIRTYYSAFFSAHAILRIFGRSCSYIDENYTKKINESLSLSTRDTQANITPGFYAIEINQDFSIVTIKKLKDSHKDTWGEFLLLLDLLSEQCTRSDKVTALSSQKEEAFDTIIRIRGILSKKNLSKIRNSVNYQHSHRLWFPYGGKSPALEYITRISNPYALTSNLYQFSDSKDEIVNFFEASIALISLLLDLIDECKNKVVNFNHVFSRGTLKLRELVGI
jgi:hypothetical protein